MDLIEATDADYLDLIECRAPQGLKLPSEGLERPEVLVMLRELASGIRTTFSPASWMMVEAGEVVGLCSVVKPPSDSGIDIGYGVSPGRRRSGLASSAVSTLVAWGRTDDRVRCIRAETSIRNIPSQRVLERNCFERVGQRIDDEDGELVCWRIATDR